MNSWLTKGPLLLVFAVVFVEAYCWVAVPKIQVGPSFKQPDSELGMVQRRDFKGRRYTHEYDMYWSTGAQGFRGGSHSKKKPPNTVRIASIGNSHTFGVGVQDDETYSKLTESALGDAEVINMSVTNGGTGIIVRTWENILGYQPDALVIRYDGWNFEDPYRQYHPGDGPLVARDHHQQKRNPLRALEDTPLRDSAAWGLLRVRYSPISKGWRLAKCRLVTIRTVNSATCLERNTEAALAQRAAQEGRLLEALSSLIASVNTPVIFLRFALTEQQAQIFDAHIPDLANVSVLDFASMVGNTDYHFAVDKHLNANGHAQVAEDLVVELKRRLTP